MLLIDLNELKISIRLPERFNNKKSKKGLEYESCYPTGQKCQCHCK